MPMKRRRSRAFLQAFSEALRLVALDYAGFVTRCESRDTEEDSRAFGARHAAARSCLAHIEQLLALIGEDAGLDPLREGFALLHEAQGALRPGGPGTGPGKGHANGHACGLANGHAPPREDGDEDDG